MVRVHDDAANIQNYTEESLRTEKLSEAPKSSLRRKIFSMLQCHHRHHQHHTTTESHLVKKISNFIQT